MFNPDLRPTNAGISSPLKATQPPEPAKAALRGLRASRFAQPLESAGCLQEPAFVTEATRAPPSPPTLRFRDSKNPVGDPSAGAQERTRGARFVCIGRSKACKSHILDDAASNELLAS